MKKIAIIGDKIDNYINAYKNLGIDLTIIDRSFNVNDFDGLLLPGGKDVNPKYYHEENTSCMSINDELDQDQLFILDSFVKANKPVFGICRGLQLINVYFDGTLIQDIDTKDIHTLFDGVGKHHKIKVTCDSFISDLYGEEFVVNSSHHQAVKDLAPGFEILAKSDDGIIEAIKHKSKNIIAVQFHPERMSPDNSINNAVNGYKLLQYFYNLI